VLPDQELYDFSVAVTHNYCAGGVVNHNTETGAAEVACHLSGWYPPWWEGRRFDDPILAWTGCETAELSRDVVQLALLGKEGEHGTGWIPGELIKKVSYRQAGVNNVVDTITVKHRSGGLSTCTLKTYRAGAGGDVARRVWQGAACHLIWLDEECPRAIYTEAQTRLLDNDGRLIATWTPLIGQTWLVGHYMGLESDTDIDELSALQDAG